MIDRGFGMHRQVKILLEYASDSMGDWLEKPAGSYTETRYYNNGREKGFHWSLNKPSEGEAFGGPTLNFVWYEHRNSDQLICIMWENPDTFQHWHEGASKLECADNVTGYQNIPEEVFPEKYDYTKAFGYMENHDAFRWWMHQVTDWFKDENNILLEREKTAEKNREVTA